ncbi:hypothetical protein [Paenibacillus woosongensis]|uniref:Uncharacterized protein n=1 Tax=Paenibacillus woosongensis TaxID=307580 RepID=A0A7X2YZP1_9BACL|nr:hypothetical protein [Paenibacillus woosongensis]MUG44171.1 hypothetical protein [Paenibacillus woosongensis]
MAKHVQEVEETVGLIAMFFDTHHIPLDNKSYRIGQFSPIYEVGYAWELAQKQVLTPKQKEFFQQLARHEITESELMKKGHPYKDPDSFNGNEFKSDPKGAHDLAPPPPTIEFDGAFSYFMKYHDK